MTGLDFHVSLTLLYRIWALVAGALTVLIVPFWLTPLQQGFFYTFASLLALQIFFELGFSQVIVLLISHEAAHITVQPDGTFLGHEDRLNRIGGIFGFVRRWFAVAAVLFAAIAGTAGWIFFFVNNQSISIYDWAPVWVVLVLLTAFNLFLSPKLALFEGLGQVGQVARLRLLQSMAGYVLLWLLLILGLELWATVSLPLMSSFVTWFWLRSKASGFRKIDRKNSEVNWRRDVLPLQWRIAVSWVSGYFLYNMFTPIAFATHGAVVAGRVGMAMTVFNAVTTLGLSWINAKAPNFTMHVSRREPRALNQLFMSVAARSVFATAAIAFSIVGIVKLATLAELEAVHRIASASTLFWIACSAVLNTASYSAATYMRAHREEPMLPVSIISAIATIIMVWLLRSDVTEMMMGYAMVGAFVSMPWTLLLFIRYRSRQTSAILSP
ncbi:MAG: hypothetical protein HEQ34_02275 [Sphingorhabdus sp.]|uniref:hypothetical protein n=1 Tax=Sphingorhabdus sp. TaxID=1902408 RepID=UPI0025FA3244|nr:hypothetical protein [Sphingorhabdus sp.]MCO4090764.1 hypothetical protein [Sphingorhabdus sp.]